MHYSKNETTQPQLITHNLIPVSTAAVLDRSIFHPMETVITIKQDTGERVPSIVKKLQQQGAKSFYPGYFSSVISAIPIRTSIYSTYLIVKEECKKRTNLSEIQIMVSAGIFSGIAEALILCPAEAYRTRKALNVHSSNLNIVKKLYSGFLPLVSRTSLENTICLVGSDMLLGKIPEEKRDHAAATYLTGLASGVASQLVGGPIDVLKTRMMKEAGQDKSIKQHVSELLKERGFFRSVGLRALRAGICNSMMLGTISVVQELMNKVDVEKTEAGNLEDVSYTKKDAARLNC